MLKALLLIIALGCGSTACRLHPKAFHPKAILACDPFCERVCGPADAGVSE